MKNIKIVKLTIAVTSIVIITKILGLCRDVALAFSFGTSAQTDAFVLALSITIIFEAFTKSVSLAFIPIYKNLEKEKIQNFLNTFYSISILLLFIITFILICSANLIVEILAPGFSIQTKALAIQILKIILLGLPLFFLVMFESQHLRAENYFIVPSYMSGILNLLLIFGFIYIAPIFGIISVAWVYLIALTIQFIFQYAVIKKMGYGIRANFDFKDEAVHGIMVLTLPILFGNAIQTINAVVDRILASGLAEGSMTALNFSNKLALFVIGIISLGAGNVCYTKMSELGAKKNYIELIFFLRSVINILNIIVVPATVGMMVLSKPITKAVFEYGAFDSDSSQMTSIALFFYALGLVGYTSRDIITRAFYSLQDSRTPMINGAVAVIINVVLNLILVRVMGIGGLALATSISAMVGAILLLVSFQRKLGRVGGKEMCVTFFKACFSAGCMGAAVHYLYPMFYQATGILAVALFLDILCGIAVYGALILFMRIREVDFVIEYLKRKLKPGNKRGQPEHQEN